MRKPISWLAGAFFLVLPCFMCAQGLQPVALPKPQATGGKPLMQALSERKSAREFSAQKLSLQTLSNLLWAGFGINRPDGRHTAPSASNAQEIDIYVFTAEGVYTYDAKGNQLQPVAAGDLRAMTGTQPIVADAAADLVFIADLAKQKNKAAAENFAFADTGFISQNIYLFSASEGLSTVVRYGIDRDALSKKLNLREDQKIILMQCVGYPKQ